MSDDRKYKQRGYKEYDSQDKGRSGGSAGPRMPVITSYKETVRCDECGADLSTLFEVSLDSLCPKCQAPFHTCRNCLHFDPSAHWECTKDIKERVSSKRAANSCPLFTVRTIRVKDLSGGTPAPPAPSSSSSSADEARKALEDLFKK